MKKTYSVSEVTYYVKHLLEEDPILRGVEVSGEISNLTYHGSGHVYFSVKDREAQLGCVMFRGNAQRAPRMQVGDKVVLTGDMTVYAPRGNYQLNVRLVRKQGMGDLYQRFLALKAALQAEGLFEQEHKKPIPVFPDCIAVITSPTGAAIRDILRTIQRRYNRGRVLIVPAIVQGEAGAGSIVRSLKAVAQTKADVVILARGGGSLEDLWNFNEEAVARAIYDCPIPVISGVGHETDITIADFVADKRASTPTAAAEHAAPDKAAWIHTLDEYERQAKRSLQYFIDFKRQVLDDYTNRLQQGCLQYLKTKKHELDLLETRLTGLDITDLLKKGYTLTLRDGKVVRSVSGLEEKDEIETVFQDGRVKSKII